MKIRAIVAGRAEENTQLEYILKDSEVDVCGQINDLEAGMETMDRVRPDLLLITGNYDRKMQLFCQQVYILYPMCAMIILTGHADESLYIRAMENGIRRVISPVPEKGLLVSVIKEVCISEQTRKGNITGDTSGLPKTEVLLVFGAKGGNGKTSLAVNLATKLAMAKRKVILVDADLQFGNTGLLLGMEPRSTMAELLQEQANPTLDTLNSFLEYHSSGLRVLFGPKSPEYADLISGRSMEKIITALRNYYDYIIIDSALGFSEVNLALLDLCSRIVTVTSPDLCTLNNTKKAFLLMESLNLGQKIRLILTERGASAVSTADVERVLGRKIDASISYDEKAMISCINQGRPVVVAAAKSRAATDYAKVAELVERGFETIRPAGILKRKKKRR